MDYEEAIRFVMNYVDKKEKMTMLVSSCGTGKTKIGAAALYAYQKSIGGGRRINVITCPSHVAKKWVREL